MLEGNKRIYEATADSLIPDWKDVNKNELIVKACECTDKELKDAYIAAIMLRYWSKMERYYYKCKLVTSPEDIHTWVTMAVLYVLEHKPWKDPNSSVYEDPNGPDKVMNIYIESRRLTFYQQLNRYKRKINSAITSLDSLVDDFKDVFMPSYNDEYDFVYNQEVINYFYKKDYFMAFMLDAILYEDVMSDGDFNKRKLTSHLRNIDDTFCDIFSKRYHIPLQDVKYSKQFITDLSSYNMKKKIEYNLIRLRKVMEEGEI